MDDLIDQLVGAVNTGPRELIFADDAPASIHASKPDDLGYVDWAIRAHDMSSVISELESRLPRAFPPSYRSLVSRYTFPGFEFGGLMFFGNTVEGTDHWELRTRQFLDPYLSKVLLDNGFLQFAGPDTGSYDPVCFDLRDAGRRAIEARIVRLNHEHILIQEKISITEIIAASFPDWINAWLVKTPQMPSKG